MKALLALGFLKADVEGHELNLHCLKAFKKYRTKSALPVFSLNMERNLGAYVYLFDILNHLSNFEFFNKIYPSGLRLIGGLRSINGAFKYGNGLAIWRS